MKLRMNLMTCRSKTSNLMRRCKALSLTILACSGLLLTASPGVANDNRIAETLQDIAHIHKPNGKHYSAGQPNQDQFQALAEHGVQHVIDLRPPEESTDINAPAWVSSVGMAYYHIPIAGGADLNRKHVAVLDTILQRIDGDSVVLHCASANRVGAMMALHAVWYQDMSEDEAIALGQAYGLTSLQDDVREALRTQ